MPKGRTSHTIGSLTLGQLYTIQMKTLVDGVRTPNWTDSVYVYPTTVADTSEESKVPKLDQYVGPVRVWLFPTYSDYRYTICLDTVPLDNPTSPIDEPAILITGITRSLEAWETATDGFVTATRVTSNSSDCDTAYDNRAANTVEFANKTDMMERCPIPSNPTAVAAGCADPNPRSSPVINKKIVSHVKISLHDDLYSSTNLQINAPRTCYLFQGINLHEGGHVFGLHDTPGDGGVVTNTVMDYDLTFPCDPTEHDVAAIKAIHQTRQ